MTGVVNVDGGHRAMTTVRVVVGGERWTWAQPGVPEPRAPRVRCRDHGVTVATVPWARHRAGHARDFDALAAWGRVSRVEEHGDGTAPRSRGAPSARSSQESTPTSTRRSIGSRACIGSGSTRSPTSVGTVTWSSSSTTIAVTWCGRAPAATTLPSTSSSTSSAPNAPPS